jgi:type IV pilus assembly protein PilN
LNKPELVVINATGLGSGKSAKKVFDFTINVQIKRPRDQEAAANSADGTATPPAPAVKP